MLTDRIFPPLSAVHYDDLYGAVLERIQSTAKLFQDDEAFYAMVEQRAGVDNSSKQLAESRDKLKKRHSELSRLLRKLFEDHAAGLIQNENYTLFSGEYQSEQAEILQKLNVLDSKLEVQNNYQTNAEKLRENIRDYLHIGKLTPFMLNKLIESIEIGQAEIANGQTQQEIIIVWRFAWEIG